MGTFTAKASEEAEEDKQLLLGVSVTRPEAKRIHDFDVVEGAGAGYADR